MTGLVAYILARKIALSAVSGIKNIKLSPTGQLIFEFNDGNSATWQIPLPKDGVSVTNIQIDNNNHLICTLSDGTTIDAGALPDKTGGGLIQANRLIDLPNPGEKDTIYLVLEEGTLYYWSENDNQYKAILGGSSAAGIDFMTSKIEFDDVAQTFDLPINNKKINVYINGMFLTEDEDYIIDRTVNPNTITFNEIWESTDLCVLTWVRGNVNGGGAIENASLAAKTDIDKLFENNPPIDYTNSTLATKADIDKLFENSPGSIDPETSSLATKADIDALF